MGAHQPAEQDHGVRDRAFRKPAGNMVRIQGLAPTIDQQRAPADIVLAGLGFGDPAQEETMTAKQTTQKSVKSVTAKGETSSGFTAEERAAMKERAKELKAEARAEKDKAAGERDVLAKIAEMPEPDRAMAERIHAVIKAAAPELSPKTWYGMPAYAKDGKVVCFFTPAHKFDSRYATFGFNDIANLDEGDMWPTSFALTELTADNEARIGALVKQAVH